MYAKERVLTTFASQEADRVPINYDSNPGIDRRLKAHFVRRPHDKLWCLVASFINPHDICYMAIREHAEGKEQQGIMRHASVELQELDRVLEMVKAYP